MRAEISFALAIANALSARLKCIFMAIQFNTRSCLLGETGSQCVYGCYLCVRCVYALPACLLCALCSRRKMQNKPKAKIIIFTFYACFFRSYFYFPFCFFFLLLLPFIFILSFSLSLCVCMCLCVHFVLVSSSLHIRHSMSS